MKKLILILAFGFGISTFAHAQAHKKNNGKVPKALMAKLNLSDDQKGKVMAIYQQRGAELDSLAARGTLDKKTLHARRKEINVETDQQLDMILTADQKKAYAEFKLDQKAKHKNLTGTATPTTPPAN